MIYSRTLLAALAALAFAPASAQAGALQVYVPIEIPEPPSGSSDSDPVWGNGPIEIREPRIDHPGIGSDEEHDRDYALVCEVTAKGALHFANRGGETMPSGLKIKWRAGDRRGAFRLNVDLEPGASAAATGIVENVGVKSCWAAVI